MTLNTSIYVNQNVTGDQTRAGLDMPSYAAKFMDEDNVIHPAVILCTDPYGYDNTYHDSDAQPKAGTRATGEFQYYDAEALAKEGSRASVRRNILSIHENLKCHKELKSGGSTATFDFKAPTDFELNYFLTLDGGVKWKVIVPCPYGLPSRNMVIRVQPTTDMSSLSDATSSSTSSKHAVPDTPTSSNS